MIDIYWKSLEFLIIIKEHSQNNKNLKKFNQFIAIKNLIILWKHFIVSFFAIII